MSDFLVYAGKVDVILNADTRQCQQELFDFYISLPDTENREAFVVALIGKLIMLKKKLSIKEMHK